MTSLPKVHINVLDTIIARRSVRNFKKKNVDSATIDKLLEAAIHAPSTMNQQPWSFVIIQNKSLLKNISDLAKPLLFREIQKNKSKNTTHTFDVFENSNFNIFYNANTLILICGNGKLQFFDADCWLAAGNLMLAASAMGLGSCVIGSALPALKSPEIKLQLNIPRDIYVVVPIIIGYPNELPIATPRKSPVIIANFTDQ